MTEKNLRGNEFLIFHTAQVWKNEKFALIEKKFRETNYLVISLVKPSF